VAIIGVLLAIAVPNFLRMRTNAQRKACITSLEKIEAAKQLWGLEKGKASGDTVVEADLVPEYIKNPPVCPAGGAYDYKTIGENALCNIPGHTL
jgi:competence protein ComGC